MAGWDNTQILAGLESVLNLATVSGMDLGQASDFVTDALTALNMEAEDAAKMVDMLAAASTNSNTTVAQMQKAFTNCAPVAGTLGITMRDLSIALGLMADKGVKGAKAGTALKNLMANLSAPTEKQLAYIRKFNLEGAQQDIVNGKLVDGLKKFKAALKDLSPQQQNAVITTIAGKEALSGISALLNTTEEDLVELENAMDGCTGSAAEMAGQFDDTLKGALLGLASAMQETLLQVFDKVQEGLKNTIKEITGFFNILNGMGQPEGYENFKGLADAMQYLKDKSEGWGQAIADSIQKAMDKINEFVNGGILDNMLQVGTNIIDGIAEGISRSASDGTLTSAITGAIDKIVTWFSENLNTIVDAGKKIVDAISKGISENKDAITDAIVSVINLQNTIDAAVAKEKWKLIGANLGTFMYEGLKSKFTTLFSGMSGFFQGLFTIGGNEGIIFFDDDEKEVGNEIVNNVKEAKTQTDKAAAELGQGISDNILAKLETMDAGALSGLREELVSLQTTAQETSAGIGQSFAAIHESSRTSFVGFTNVVRNQMLNMTNIMRNQMLNVSNIVRNQCLNMSNIFRNQFVNMANIARNQMVNVSNIIRNQAVAWANIIRNQVPSARNALTQQFLSMASVTRTQMLNISNIIRNQAVTWANIISNQAKNARDNLTRQFMSMAAVVNTQMAKCLSYVKSYMSQIKTATNKTLNVKVNKSVTTTTKAVTATSNTKAMPSMASAFYAANTASTLSLADASGMGLLASRAGSAIGSGGITGSSSRGGDSVVLEIPVLLDGRELARSSAKYIDGELKTISKRENRKRGVK